jgi:hypothetical protein
MLDWKIIQVTDSFASPIELAFPKDYSHNACNRSPIGRIGSASDQPPRFVPSQSGSEFRKFSSG